MQGGNKAFIAEVSLYCAELLNKWSASDPAYSVDTMARSAEYAAEAAQQYEQIECEVLSLSLSLSFSLSRSLSLALAFSLACYLSLSRARSLSLFTLNHCSSTGQERAGDAARREREVLPGQRSYMT